MDTASTLWAISAVDGRYQKDLVALGPLVSEGGLMRFRLMIEAAWLLHLNDHPDLQEVINLSKDVKAALAELECGTVTADLIRETKVYERTTNHDVKAVEYVLRDVLKKCGATDKQLCFVHFACTSEDINNLSYALMLKESRAQVLLPAMTEIIAEISALAINHKSLAMLSRTHGQTATPTTLGKEMAVFYRRLSRQLERLKGQPIEGKINGAVGNYNAHVSAFSRVDWVLLSQEFVEKRLGLQWNPLTTQIETHDSYVEYMEVLRLFNMILLDFARDMWGYISHGYFAQKTIAGEVGSSTMPHKVNPIYFENAEGNIGLANAVLSHFGEKLPVSRFQRDLSDSTVLRATGTALGHTLLAWKSILKGLSRVEANPKFISADLNDAWEVLGEAVQTVMRRHGVTDAYERLKVATRGQAVVTRDMIHAAVEACPELPNDEKKYLKELTPSTYTGLAASLVERFAMRVT